MRTGLKEFMLFVIGILVAMFGFPVLGYSSSMPPVLKTAIYIVILQGFAEEQIQTEEKIKSYMLKFDDYYPLDFNDSKWAVSYIYTEDSVNGNSFSILIKDDNTTVFLRDEGCDGSVDKDIVWSGDSKFNGRGLNLLYFRYMNKLVYRYKKSK